ncbi:hypothetical protein N802_07140 [Knoellia sinensis KCTC 19936]|uniref:Uncharacterized protein n=1 Tax=Knoellia sinensis KCTC 19936 TaxID=1385520 RepID=A0A0A0J2P4_9MICO|nr:hypothetical protein [Knoellia sinensis]KGN30412.1 hypothetical protein N802_07140 [Knoellia sinensis KCTC 19936]
MTDTAPALVAVPASPQPRTDGSALIGPLVLSFVQAAALAGVVAAVAWMGPHVHADATLHKVALFVHLASLVLGFGAVLAVDWTGARRLLGHHGLTDVIDVASRVNAAIWVGYAGLVASGAFLVAAGSAGVSQVGWWGATVIGFLNGR